MKEYSSKKNYHEHKKRGADNGVVPLPTGYLSHTPSLNTVFMVLCMCSECDSNKQLLATPVRCLLLFLVLVIFFSATLFQCSWIANSVLLSTFLRLHFMLQRRYIWEYHFPFQVYKNFIPTSTVRQSQRQVLRRSGLRDKKQSGTRGRHILHKPLMPESWLLLQYNKSVTHHKVVFFFSVSLSSSKYGQHHSQRIYNMYI